MVKTEVIFKSIGIFVCIIACGGSFALDEIQTMPVGHENPASDSAQSNLAGDYVHQAGQIAQCKETKEAKLTLISGYISDFNKYIEEQRHANDNEKEMGSAGDDARAKKMEVAKYRIQAMDAERARMFVDFKKLGGENSEASSVKMLISPCKDQLLKLNSMRSDLYEKSTKPEPVMKHANIVANSCSALVYPRISMQIEQEGRVVIGMVADNNGNVVDRWIVQSSGYRLLDQSALNSAQTCKLKTEAKIEETNLLESRFGIVFKLPD